MNTKQILQEMIDTGVGSAPLLEPLPKLEGYTKPLNPEQLEIAKEMTVLNLANKLADWQYFPDPFSSNGKLTPQQQQEKDLYRYDLIPILDEGIKVTVQQEDELFAEDPANPTYSVSFELSEGMFKGFNQSNPHAELNHQNTVNLTYSQWKSIEEVIQNAEFAPIPLTENAPFTQEEIDCFKISALENCKGHMVEAFRENFDCTSSEDGSVPTTEFWEVLSEITPALNKILEFKQGVTTMDDGFKVYGQGELSFTPNAMEALPQHIEAMQLQQSMELTQTASRKAML